MNGNGLAPTTRGRRDRGPVPRSLLAAVAVFALALAASCGGASGGAGGERPAGGDGQDAPDGGQAIGQEALGDADAPVVLTEYADYG